MEIEESDEALLNKTETKASTNDLYAVQVKQGLKNYGYGIFDDEHLINLPLQIGSTYTIEVSLVPNGKNVIAKGANGGYEAPFKNGSSINSNNVPGKITNEFIVTSDPYIENMNEGKAVVKEDGTEYS
ncbi:MAG: hypothetical protein K2K83_04370, partial [Rikenella sp.]|nr:hypothetical protein [Rikenella sp.]